MRVATYVFTLNPHSETDRALQSTRMNFAKVILLIGILGSLCLSQQIGKADETEPLGRLKPIGKSGNVSYRHVNCEDVLRWNPLLRPTTPTPLGIRLKPVGRKKRSFISSNNGSIQISYKVTQGPAGPPGFPGSPGRPGEKGSKGTPGQIVRPKTPLPSGTKCNCINGRQGSKGIKGIPGISGLPGEKGLPGRVGAVGDRGSAGAPGSPGPSASALTMGYPSNPDMMYVLFNQDGNLPRVVCHHFRRQVYVPGIPNTWLGWYQNGKSGYLVHNKWLYYMSTFLCPCSVNVPPGPTPSSS